MHLEVLYCTYMVYMYSMYCKNRVTWWKSSKPDNYSIIHACMKVYLPVVCRIKFKFMVGRLAGATGHAVSFFRLEGEAASKIKFLFAKKVEPY